MSAVADTNQTVHEIQKVGQKTHDKVQDIQNVGIDTNIRVSDIQTQLTDIAKEMQAMKESYRKSQASDEIDDESIGKFYLHLSFIY